MKGGPAIIVRRIDGNALRYKPTQSGQVSMIGSPKGFNYCVAVSIAARELPRAVAGQMVDFALTTAVLF